MFCETYNKSLTHAAASGELSAAQCEHLASCEPCRIAFASEQSLFATIESGLRAAANSEVPVTLIPRVLVAINNEPAQQPSFQKWIFAGAVVSCALAATIILQLKRRESPVPFKTAVTQAPARPAPQLGILRPSVSGTAPESPGRVNKSETVRPSPTDAAASMTAEVLVPDEERAAFAKFLAGEHIVSSKSSAVVLRVPEAPRDLAPLRPVEIARLEVLPLNGEEGSRGEF
jgi:anti-sigma factor RsiW